MFSVKPLSQSLPELLHHFPNIVNLLIHQINICDHIVLPTYCRLVIALARYIFASLWLDC